MHAHERTTIVEKAEIAFRTRFSDWLYEHDDLTYIELFGIINRFFGSWIKYALRVERHPDDAGKSADEA